MAYSAVWSESIPAGSIAASDLDQAIRDAKRDIRERMSTVFGMADWSADPLVIQQLAFGTNPASTGLIRSPNNVAIEVARNALNTADFVITKLNSSNIVELAGAKLTLDPTLGTLGFTVAQQKISLPAGSYIDFRANADASSVLLVKDDGSVQLSTGQLALYAGNAAKAPLLVPDMSSAAAPSVLADGMLWFIANDLWRRIGGVSKKVTFV